MTAEHNHLEDTFEGPAPSPVCGFHSLTDPDQVCKYPPHHLGASHSWQDFAGAEQEATNDR
jgi:hypothetical protein